ncbi:hypothetical protein CEJ45_19385 [Herbaspirillum aquaticum]|uniref:Uncharacterized protein n=2 Tax=Herbaspirillum aquaticum TaxID=568783 RepID=A0A225SP27_9BURK|nr:hypothetical protein CEJ45_19385 [Herbaspirillum aquaticum]
MRNGKPYFSTGQQQWNKEVSEALNAILPGVSSANKASFSMNFGSIPLQSAVNQTTAAAGAKPGDIVALHPSSYVAGVIFTGVVGSSGNVTVYAHNYTSDTVTPGTVQFTAIFLR